MDVEPIPLVDLGPQHRELAPAILESLRSLVAAASFIGGPAVQDFETRFAAFAGSRHAVGVANGTCALTLALRAAGIKPGDEVITVASTFIATVEAILNAGAQPVLVDVDPHSALMDLEQVEAALGPRSRAVVGVHLYGTPLDLGRLSEICRQRRLLLVQDAAQAHGARWDGRPLAEFGAAQTYSFFPGKNLGAWGDAGAVCCDDPELAGALRAMRDHGRHPGDKYLHHCLGGNYRLDALQALVLTHKLPSLETRNQTRRRLYRLYREALEGVGDLRFPTIDPRATPVHHLLVLRSRQRDSLAAFLRQRGIQTGLHYPVPLHRQPALERLGCAAGALPRSEELAREVLSLPFYAELEERQLGRVAEAVREFFASQRDVMARREGNGIGRLDKVGA